MSPSRLGARSSGSGAHPAKAAGIPANIRESAERLARELRPDLGPVDWQPVRQRRRRAEARLRAMVQYANGASCRRRALVGYFGESLATCSGCDRCRVRPGASPAARSRRRATRAPAAGARRQGRPLGRLSPRARRPAPAGADPAFNGRRTGRRGRRRPGARRALRGHDSRSPGRDAGTDSRVAAGAAERALEEWRAAVAREMGVPVYAVLGDRALAQLAAGDAADCRVARSGTGPRFRAKFDAELRRLLERLGRPPATSPSPPGP